MNNLMYKEAKTKDVLKIFLQLFWKILKNLYRY